MSSTSLPGRRIFRVVIADAVDRREMIPGRLTDDLAFRDFIDKQAAAEEDQTDQQADRHKKAFSQSIHKT